MSWLPSITVSFAPAATCAAKASHTGLRVLEDGVQLAGRLALVGGEREARRLREEVDPVARDDDVRHTLRPVLRGDPADETSQRPLPLGPAHLEAGVAPEVEVGDHEYLLCHGASAPLDGGDGSSPRAQRRARRGPALGGGEAARPGAHGAVLRGPARRRRSHPAPSAGGAATSPPRSCRRRRRGRATPAAPPGPTSGRGARAPRPTRTRGPSQVRAPPPRARSPRPPGRSRRASP